LISPLPPLCAILFFFEYHVQIPPIRVNVEFEGQTEEIQIPNNDTVTIRDVARIIRNAFPNEASFGRQLPDIKRGSDASTNRGERRGGEGRREVGSEGGGGREMDMVEGRKEKG
jgi:hypothetical protein